MLCANASGTTVSSQSADSAAVLCLWRSVTERVGTLYPTCVAGLGDVT